MDLAPIIAIGFGLTTIGAVAAYTYGLHRQVAALRDAVAYHSAPDRARVLIIRCPYAGGEYTAPTALLRRGKWQVTEVRAGAADRDWFVLLPQFDVLIVCGMTAAENEALARDVRFQQAREHLWGVGLYTPDSRKVFYPLHLWLDQDQGLTTPGTADTMVFVAAARARRMAADTEEGRAMAAVGQRVDQAHRNQRR